MHRLRHLRGIVACGVIQRQGCEAVLDKIGCAVSSGLRALSATAYVREEEPVAKPLRSTKPKSKKDTLQYFVDMKTVRTLFREILPVHEHAIVFLVR